MNSPAAAIVIFYNINKNLLQKERFGMKKNKTFVSSIRCAFNGLFTAMDSEKNFKAYMWHVLVTLPINLWFHFSTMEWLVYIVCVLGVFSC